jgi:hypothetical protein
MLFKMSVMGLLTAINMLPGQNRLHAAFFENIRTVMKPLRRDLYWRILVKVYLGQRFRINPLMYGETNNIIVIDRSSRISGVTPTPLIRILLMIV